MSNTQTLLELKTRARERADMENSTFISDSELSSFINSSYAELHDLVVSSFEDYHTKEVSLTVASGASEITLPSDFYKFRGLDREFNTGEYYAVKQFNFRERNVRNRSLITSTYGTVDVQYRLVGSTIQLTPETHASGTYRLWYIPTFTRLTSDTDTLDGVNGWEELVVIGAAIKMLDKEESDVSVLMKEKGDIEDRIIAMAKDRDMDQAEVITDSSIDLDSSFPFGRS